MSLHKEKHQSTITKPLHDNWLKLGLGYLFLQTVALSALMNTSNAADDAENQSARVFPVVQEADGKAELKPHVGVQAGYQNLKGPVDGNVAVAIDVGIQPVVPFSLGLQVQYSPSELNTAAAEDMSFDTTNVLAKAAYNFGGDIPVIDKTQIGVKTGITRYSGEGDAATRFAIGPFIAMDFAIDENQKFTVGPEFSYLGVIGNNSPDQFSAAGTMKYWF